MTSKTFEVNNFSKFYERHAVKPFDIISNSSLNIFSISSVDDLYK
jgi:hypothetical protein